VRLVLNLGPGHIIRNKVHFINKAYFFQGRGAFDTVKFPLFSNPQDPIGSYESENKGNFNKGI